MSGRSQFSLLFDNAWRRFTRLDGLARDADPRSVLALAAIACGVPGAFLAFILALPVMIGGHWQLVDARPVLHELAWFSALLVALAALLEWDALLPDPGDCAVLVPLPVARRTVALAHAAALAALLAILMGAVNVSSLMLIPMFDAVHATFLMGVARQAGGVVITAVIAFSAIVILRALALGCAAIPVLRHVGPLLQMLGLVGVIAALLVLPVQSELRWAWGRGFASPLPLAPWAALLAVVAIGLFALAGQRAFLPWQPARSSTRRLWGNPWMRGTPASAAVRRFTFRTLARGSRQRAVMDAWFALGAGVALASAVRLSGTGQAPTLAASVRVALSAPLVLELFLLTGLRSSFAVPIEIRANWIFRLRAGQWSAKLAGAARAVMYAYLGVLLLPVAAFDLWF